MTRADPIRGRQRNRMSKNRITIEQLALACKHVDEMMSLGVSENLAIRTLEIFADVYANMAHGGSAVPHAADRVQLWSIEAKKLKDQHPNDPRGLHVRVEHGTPRRSFARDVLSLYKSDNLTDQAMLSLATMSWKLAVITLEEDVRLNKLARSRAASSPVERWKMAGISFDENSN